MSKEEKIKVSKKNKQQLELEMMYKNMEGRDKKNKWYKHEFGFSCCPFCESKDIVCSYEMGDDCYCNNCKKTF